MPPTTAISSATFPMTSSVPSSPSSPPSTAPARRPSHAGGARSGAPPLSTSSRVTSAPTSSSASPSSLRSSPNTLALPAFSRSTASASTRAREVSPNKPLKSSDGSTPALDGLQELNISFDLLDSKHRPEKRYPLPPSVLLCASTLAVARISFYEFPKAPSVSFSLLKQLDLFRVSISEDVFHDMLSSCPVLESLYLERLQDVGCFRISSPTLRSVGLCSCFLGKGELVIEDAPRLERLLLPRPDRGRDTIRVIRAPKLEILGLLSPCISELQIAKLAFKSLAPASLKNTISTVKVLALQFSLPSLGAVIDVLRCFPCLEKLYVIWKKHSGIPMENVPQYYDSLDPVECLETHLKELVVKKYEGSEGDVSFAKFFVFNAKVLKRIKFRVDNKINEEWVSDQHMLLEVGARASRDAQLEFVHSNSKSLDVHDLSIVDPFTCYLVNGVDALSEESH